MEQTYSSVTFSMTMKRSSSDKIMICEWSKPIPALKLRSKARLVVVGADGCRALLEIEVNTEDIMTTAICHVSFFFFSRQTKIYYVRGLINQTNSFPFLEVTTSYQKYSFVKQCVSSAMCPISHQSKKNGRPTRR